MGQWLADFRWAMNVMRARRFRRSSLFFQRELFDIALRPKIEGEPGKVIAYPDAFYHVAIDDLLRAMLQSRARG